MLTHIITDLPPQQSTSRTAYPMKRSQNLRQMHFLPLLKATVKQETQQSTGVKGILRSLGQTKFMPPNPDQT